MLPLCPFFAGVVGVVVVAVNVSVVLSSASLVVVLVVFVLLLSVVLLLASLFGLCCRYVFAVVVQLCVFPMVVLAFVLVLFLL